MNFDNDRLAVDAICHAADMVKIAWQEAAWEQQRPSVVFKPELSKDGDMWCALFGDNLQEGVAGFSPRPADAMWAFDQAWLSESGSYIIGRKDQPHD
ncbi:MAG: hypothetical protein KGL39_58260 [Patescibacteria group bacterium]|nr:hypothetical protein [Patescibacteria group bacterium]